MTDTIRALLILSSVLPCIYGQDNSIVRSIGQPRFVAGSQIYGAHDGVLELLYKPPNTLNGVYGTVCNFGFDNYAASITCYMMGYGFNGIVLNTGKRGSGQVMYSDFDCSSVQRNETANYHLGRCGFRCCAGNVPQACMDHSRDVHIACLRGNARLDCTQGSSLQPNFRLVPQGGVAGLVQVKSGTQWGNVCAEEMTVNEARILCLRLCNSSNTIFYARPVLQKYAPGASPIYLSNLQCPSNVADYSNCTKAPLGQASGCAQVNAVGLSCGPESATTVSDNPPYIHCMDQTTFVYFDTGENPDLTPDMLVLDPKHRSAACNYRTGQNATYVWAAIPQPSCNPDENSNTTHIILSFNLVRKVRAADGVYWDVPRTFRALCLIPRKDSVDSKEIGVVPRTLPPVVEVERPPVQLKLYQDALFARELIMPATVKIGVLLYAKVTLITPLTSLRLILRDSWATPTTNKSHPIRYDLLKDWCIVQNRITLTPISSKEMAFSFRAFQFANQTNTTASSVSEMQSIFLHCSTSICRRGERSQECQGVCSGSGRRKREAIEPTSSRTYSVTVDAGPLLLLFDESDSATAQHISGMLIAMLVGLLGVMRWSI